MGVCNTILRIVLHSPIDLQVENYPKSHSLGVKMYMMSKSYVQLKQIKQNLLELKENICRLSRQEMNLFGGQQWERRRLWIQATASIKRCSTRILNGQF